MAAKWLDKILNRFGLRRAYNGIEGGGTLTSSSMWDWIMSPFTGWNSIDTELRSRLPYLRREARKMAFNNPIISQYLELLKDNVIGASGIRLQAQLRNNDGKLNKAFNDKIEAAWADFWANPWADGRFSGVGGEQLLLQTMAVDGEIFVRRIISTRFKYGIALQMIDPDQIDSNFNRPRGTEGNEVRLGIEVDEYGKPLAYWCYTSNPNDMNGNRREQVRIPADEIIHIFDPERIGQTRGYTWFNTVMQNLRNLDGYVEAAIMAARTAACAVPIFKMNPEFGVDEKAKGFQVNINPGTGFTLPAGLEMQDWDPKHPTTNHAEFIKGNLRFSSSGLHVSYNALANDLENVNCSSMRSGLLIERDGWRNLQQMWAGQFLTPVYGWFLWGALLTGNLVLDSRDPKKFMAVKWIPRGWAWVDPLKDMTAAVLGIENLMGSRTKYLAEQGDDFEDICSDLVNENTLADQNRLNTTTEPAPPANRQQKKNAALRLAVVNMLLDDESELDTDRLAGLLKGHSHG